MTKPTLTSTSAKCFNCGALSYMEISSWWPTDPTSFPKNTSNAEYYKKLSEKLHVRILTCVGCQKPEVNIYPEGVLESKYQVVWPKQSRQFPNSEFLAFIPKAVVKDFLEASSIEYLSPTASATLSRRCLQTILKDKYASIVGNASKLKKQVELVLAKNELPTHISDELHSIRSIGNNAAHPNIEPSTNEIIEVESGEASACLDVIEDLIDHAYVKPLSSAKRKAEREKKHGLDTK